MNFEEDCRIMQIIDNLSSHKVIVTSFIVPKSLKYFEEIKSISVIHMFSCYGVTVHNFIGDLNCEYKNENNTNEENSIYVIFESS